MEFTKQMFLINNSRAFYEVRGMIKDFHKRTSRREKRELKASKTMVHVHIELENSDCGFFCAGDILKGVIVLDNDKVGSFRGR